jgi:hypothetical protein
MNDLLGNELKVDDEVVFLSPFQDRLRVGRVATIPQKGKNFGKAVIRYNECETFLVNTYQVVKYGGAPVE